jgi:hypothetical protein
MLSLKKKYEFQARLNKFKHLTILGIGPHSRETAVSWKKTMAAPYRQGICLKCGLLNIFAPLVAMGVHVPLLLMKCTGETYLEVYTLKCFT